MKLLTSLGSIALALFVTHAHAANTEAIGNATVQVGGVRTGSNGLAFLNIEGSNNGSFASYGAIRFDLSAVKSQFDALYGTGSWTVAKITLQLTQSNAAFTTDGDVGVYFSGNDSVALASPSPLTYAGFGSNFADASLVLGYGFRQTSSGAVDNYTLFDRQTSHTAGADALTADVLGDTLTTLLLRDQSPGVAATYAGYTNFSYAGPTLVIDAVAAVPEPSTYALFATGLGAVGLLMRRRRG